MNRADYILKRTGFAIATVFVALTLNFLLFHALPGSAVSDLSRVPNATPQLRHALAAEFGLDKPLWVQYVDYLKQLVHGNMGISFDTQQSVRSELWQDLKNTIPMVTLGTVFSIVFGVGFGVLAAWRRNTATDHVWTNIALAFYSLPTQWL